jgi:hypothetical protein
MSASATADGPPARLAPAALGTAAALKRNSNASGMTTMTAAPAASHLNTDSPLSQVPAKATRRCAHPVRSPCKRHPPPAERHQNSPLTTSCHHEKAVAQVDRAGGSGTALQAARTPLRTARSGSCRHVISSRQMTGSTHRLPPRSRLSVAPTRRLLWPFPQGVRADIGLAAAGWNPGVVGSRPITTSSCRPSSRPC